MGILILTPLRPAFPFCFSSSLFWALQVLINCTTSSLLLLKRILLCPEIFDRKEKSKTKVSTIAAVPYLSLSLDIVRGRIFTSGCPC